MDTSVADLAKNEMEALLAQAKRQLRARMRGLRSALPASAIAARSGRIVERVAALGPVRDAKSVALFWPMANKNEVDLVPLDATLRAQGKRLYYPFMTPTETGYHTGFRLLSDVGLLEQRGRGFSEPPLDAAEATRGDIDAVVVPALAVSADGYRIGYGIGFYDVTLPDVCPPASTVVVAFSFQLLAEAPHDEGDFPCDWVVTDASVTDARSARGPA
ncbi:MAG: 5-formyltetrahydrofolate cyclo-ligase [Sorangiineae bacterium PRO1]|nr:5-formyltetrahydrofolate cyclo-ligase [Sorangiineae bacterium PRO1]